MRIIGTRRCAALALICVGLVIGATSTVSATEAVTGPAVTDVDPSPGAYDVECEDLETGVITPGPCPDNPDAVIVWGDGTSTDPGASRPTTPSGTPAAPGPVAPGPAVAVAAREDMTLTVTPDRLRLGNAASDTIVLNAPRSVSVSVAAGATFYRPAGRGRTFMEARVGDRQGRTVSFSSTNVSNCTPATLTRGGATLYTQQQIPRGFAALVQFANIAPFTLTFTCDVS